MNWKNEAADKLRMYEAKKQALQSIPKEVSRLEQDFLRIRSATADGTPVRGGGSGREDMLLNNIVCRQELERSLKQVQDWIDFVDGGLSVLGKEERLVLERFYIHPEKGAADRLCGELNLEKSQVYARKDAALLHFTRAVYGCTET